MTLRARLSLTLAGIALLLVLPSVYGWTQLNRVRDLSTKQRRSHGEAYIAIGAVQSGLAELVQAVSDYTVTELGQAATGRTADTTDVDNLQLAVARLATIRQNLDSVESANYGQEADVLRERFARIGVLVQRIALLFEADRLEEGTSQVNELNRVAREIGPVIASTFRTVDNRSDADLKTAESISTNAVTAALSALLICVGLAVVLSAWTTRSMTLPIVRLRNAMAIVADGNFRVPEQLAYGRRDEIGSAARSFRAMTHRLADLDRLKAEFMSFATHELRTPLNVVTGYADLLREGTYGEMSPAQIEAIEAVRDQTRVILDLVNQLLDISRLEAGGMRVHIREVRTMDLFQRVERAFEPLARRNGVGFSVVVDESVPSMVHLDGERVADQVLGNLLSNALKFTPGGGEIRVTAHGTDYELAIEVSDTGPGIPEDKLGMIFQKYYQVDDEARRKGAGLGLSIARDVVRAHGGTIHAESEQGVGTTIRVMLPLGAAAAAHNDLVADPA